MSGASGAIGEVAAALDTLAELGPGRLPSRDVATAAALRGRIDERLAFGDGLTVVAVAGGTGVGKSSLVNRLVDAEVAVEGVRRPTTARPLAVTANLDSPTRSLLDWLAVDDRRTVPDSLPDGLVLLDLPDHDSVAEDHRRTSARLARRVDALLVVVDPVKYARADLHHGPLAELTHHAEVVTVVLNRIDELGPDDIERCLDDLRATLVRSGHAATPVVATSAATGAGVERLRAGLDRMAEERTAATRRLTSDAARLGASLTDDLPALPDVDIDEARLLDAILDATDAHRVIAEAQTAFRSDGRYGCTSPFARIVRAPFRLVAGFARQLGVGDRPGDRAGPGRAASRVEAALAAELRLSDTVGATHATLGRTIEDTAAGAAAPLADAVNGVGVRPLPRRWWSVMAAARGIAEVAAIAGLVWQLTIGVVTWLGLPALPVPQPTDELTWPAALLLGGVGVRLVLGLLTRLAVSVGARRHREVVEERLRRRVRDGIEDRILAPYREELGRHARLRQAIATLERAV